MEISINEYVRTDNGIIGEYVKFRGWQDAIETNNDWIGFDIDKDIVKHSKDIIDLIEVGDYVNGHKIVNEIWGEDDNNLYFEIEGGFNKAQYIREEDIKSIITKEQIKQIEYRIKE